MRVWSAILRTAARAGLTRRDPLEDESAAVRDGTGRINLFDIPIGQCRSLFRLVELARHQILRRVLLVIELLMTRSIHCLVDLDVEFWRRLTLVPEAFSWSFAYDSEIPILENPESLATIWRKIRAKGCELPSLEHMRERDAYVRMAVANAKEEVVGHLLTIQQLWGELDTAREAERQREVDFEELRKKMAAAEAEKILAQSDLNSMEEKYRREIEGRDRKARKDLHLARVSLAKEYEGVLDVVRGKFEQKKKETAAEILLQETRARIEALTEYSEGGLELEAELERLKDLEISLDID
ncbi:hypothetical protein DY000_02027214 [Brassica cretica]|uniref:Oberon coiled-coil region domain-containing protein n=1 Tax=Brassica cretica TaxID=69181 RepID=A0ABQ7EF24_BRACR|nr:hypothetical protein DY000_02027214 [Brassica cretica]